MKNLIRKIKADSSPQNQLKGQLSTLAATVLTVVSNSGLLNNYPVIKSVTDMLSGALFLKAGNHALKTK